MPSGTSAYDMPKVTLVEHVDEFGQWQWYGIYADTTPKKALLHYSKEMRMHLKEFKFEKRSDALYLGDEARAYQVTLQKI